MLDDINFEKYIRLTSRDGKPYLDLDLIAADPGPRQMLIYYLGFHTKDLDPEIILGLPNTGPALAKMMAQFSGKRYVRARKGKRFDESEYLTILYRESESGEESERKGKRHLQIRREALKKTINSNDGTLFRTALLVDGLLEDGDKALETAKKLKEVGIRTVGFSCVVELREWDGKPRRGREILEEERINVKSILVYENGKYRTGDESKHSQPIVDEKRGIIIAAKEKRKVVFEDDYSLDGGM